MGRKLIPTNTERNDVVYTPEYLTEQIVKYFNPTGKLLEPCKGSGNFLKYMPNADWCEIQEGIDFFDYHKKVDWIITNPPYSIFRKFLNHSMEVSDNIVFLVTINHIWLKARLRDIENMNFGIKEILLIDTPNEFPQSGFQYGVIHFKKNYIGDIKLSKLRYEKS
jgi:hypothetical protein